MARDLKHPSFNTLLVFLAAVPQLREFSEANRHRNDVDPKHDFPGFDYDRIREAVQEIRGTSARPMRPDEVEQHVALLNRNYLVSHRPNQSTPDRKVYNVPDTGEVMYALAITAEVQGQMLIEYIQSPHGHECWQELWVLAVFWTGKLLSEDDLSRKTSIPMSSVTKARRAIQRGFEAKHRDGTTFRFQADLEVVKAGDILRFRLPKEMRTPSTADLGNMDDVFDSLSSLPGEPDRESEVAVAEPLLDEGDLSQELEQTLQSQGLTPTTAPTTPDNGGLLLAPGLTAVTIAVRKEDVQALQEDADQRGVALDRMLSEAMGLWAEEAREAMRKRQKEELRGRLAKLQREHDERLAEMMKIQGLLDPGSTEEPPTTL